MTRRPLIAVLAALMVLGALVGRVVAGGSTASASADAASSGTAVTAAAPATAPIIVIGTGGISWSDVSEKDTPALWSFLRDGGAATLTVRSVHTNTCPVDGWLTLAAGERAGQPDVPGTSKPPCRALDGKPGADGKVPHWADYTGAAADMGFDAHLGLLADQAASGGACVQAIGPGAALGAARSSGVVQHYADFGAGDQLTRDLATCPLTLVDTGVVRDPADVDPHDAVRPTDSRAQQVRAVDNRIRQVLDQAPAGADLMLVSLADAGQTERLRLLALKGPQFGAGTLYSASTRQPGLVQLADVAPTVLSHIGAPVPGSLGGTALRNEPAENNSEASAQDRLGGLVDYDLASHEVHSLVPPFFTGWVYAQLAIYLFVAVVWRRRWGTLATRMQLLRVVRRVAIIASTVPVSTFLANLLPWWRFPVPMIAVVASVGVFVAAISALALRGPWRRALFGPLVVVSVVTIAVLAADVMTGSRLQLSSLMGLQPVVGGRFYGMGNVTFALFATATLLLAIAVADRLTRTRTPLVAAVAVSVVGLFGVVVDGSPSWGSDFGGPPALLPGLAYLVLAVLGIRLTWRKALLVVGGTAGFLVVVGFLDWLRPPDSRSHLGRFVQTAIDGGAWDIIARKAQQNFSILTGSTLTLLVPVGLAFMVYILARPTSWGARAMQRSFERAPLLRPGLISLCITLVIGFAMNDSGTAIPAVAATLAIPLMIAVNVQVLEDDEGRPVRAETPGGPAPSDDDSPEGGEGPEGHGEPVTALLPAVSRRGARRREEERPAEALPTDRVISSPASEIPRGEARPSESRRSDTRRGDTRRGEVRRAGATGRRRQDPSREDPSPQGPQVSREEAGPSTAPLPPVPPQVQPPAAPTPDPAPAADDPPRYATRAERRQQQSATRGGRRKGRGSS